MIKLTTELLYSVFVRVWIHIQWNKHEPIFEQESFVQTTLNSQLDSVFYTSNTKPTIYEKRLTY